VAHLNIGDTFDRYVIEAVLGEGGMGRVYRALDPRLGRRVALKVLIEGGVSEAVKADAALRMMREARSAAAFSHPNVVAIHDVGEASGAPYITMELVSGATLRSYVGSASVPIEQRVAWLKDVARGLGAAHRAGLVHRDIKPENVMVTPDGVVKILDFGIARRFEDGALVDATGETALASLASLTTEGMMIGTPQYMPPEQLQAKSLDGRADQFAWGVMAWELLGGKLPWGGVTNGAQLVAAVLATPVAPLVEIVPGVSAEVSLAVARALSKDRDQRFATMDDLLAAIERRPTPAALPTPVGPSSPSGQDLAFEATAIQPSAPAARTSVATEDRATAKRQRRPLRLIVIGLVAVVATGLPTVWRWKGQGHARDTPKRASPPSVEGAKEGPILGECPDGTTTDCSSASHPWCDQSGRFVACCAPGLVAVGDDGACDCPPGGMAPGAERGDCPTAGDKVGVTLRGDDVLATLRPKLKDCYDRALTTNQDLGGVAVVRISVAPDGRVFRARVKEGRMSSVSMQNCLLARIREARFGPPAGGMATINLPLSFVKDEDGEATRRAKPDGTRTE
jgi:serine/threonine-protein kinase